MAVPALLMVMPGAVAVPAPASAEEPGLTFECTCTPDTFRPNEWVVLECTSHLANEGGEPLVNIRARIGSPRGVTPDYFWMWYTLDGEFVPIDTGALSIGREGGVLEPGQAVESRLVALVWMRKEGTYESELTLSVGEQDLFTQPIRLTAVAEATAPPADLLVSYRLAGEQVDGDGVTSAVYATVVTNQGSSTVTGLKVANRYSDPAALVKADPAPASEKAAFGLAYWDLASFGKESLAPGEWLELRTTYGPAADIDCGHATSGVVVGAMVDGQERRYGAQSEEGATVGECRYEEEEYGRGGGGPVAFGRGGEGPAGREVDVLWAVAVLAAGGASLVGAALALRRRPRA